ncbi:bifunctional 4-hydroxy-2-oxoglutarate aldolase/2-dehydro-3-deoxy-phosphogluconate aldolase [Rappaport israeli]|uniref:bifunctional 4-hydroxy-2-oxoglutarate aldolase/2-dehydro-3-deoxy-phosphogluconate aldolase n=1 Tax=Rappaport israeli TaxID=1839807 RepID=UPI0018E98F3A|nr:keto-deoxy-phosphogluconate aldolase [Rappaport israeli]
MMRSQNKQTIQAQLAAKRSVVPVVVIERAEDALPLARAILAGGGISIEITLRTQAGLKAIEAIANSDLEIVVGAGTVLTVEDAKQAIAAGAQFLVSPGLDSEVVEYALAQEVLMIPGVMTPSEVLTAKRLGLEMLKFFPAQLAGSVGMLKNVCIGVPNDALYAYRWNKY